MTVFWRYWLLQVPGWGVLLAVLLLARGYFDLSTASILAIFALWFLKDWALYPMLKKHYRIRSDHPSTRLVGARAIAQEPLRPAGYVRVRGELWLAEIARGARAVEAGEEVIVESVEGLTLRVRGAG